MSTEAEQTRNQSRADRIRARRKSADGSAVPAASKPKTAQNQPGQEFSPPAYLGEGSLFARPTNAPKKSRFNLQSSATSTPWNKPTVTKRIAIPLNKQGAELQVPSLPIITLNWRVASLLIVMAMLALIITFSQLKVEDIQFEGVSSPLAADIRYLLQLQGRPIHTINPAHIREVLTMAFPELVEARISVALPNRVSLVAKARQPLYAWVVESRVYLIDDQHIIYPANPGEDLSSLIVINADHLPPVAPAIQHSPDIINEIFTYLRKDASERQSLAPQEVRSSYLVDEQIFIALRELAPFIPENATIRYSSRHGFGWNAPQGWDAWFGVELADLTAKIAIYDAIVQKITQESIDASLISVEHIRAPYIRER